jgi:hypothetical protein
LFLRLNDLTREITFSPIVTFQNWKSRSGWRVRVTDPSTLPGDPDFPKIVKREKDDYNDLGFKAFVEANPWAERTS